MIYDQALIIVDAIVHKGEMIMSEPTRSDDVTTYGHLAAIVGFLFAAGIVWFMFSLADGFS